MAIKKRSYKNYNEYLKHQGNKLTIGVRKKIKKFMPEYIDSSIHSFEKRINKFKTMIGKGKVLCLGARTGAEVVAFRNLGFPDTMGIDINPGKDNPYVIKGDFHNMQFRDNNFDIIYTNCIDHAWDLKKFNEEVNRVLVPNGRLVLEIDHTVNKSKNNRLKIISKKSKYESIIWESVKDIEKGLTSFKVVDRFNSACFTFAGIIFNVRK